MRLPCMPSSTAIASCSSHRACRWGPSAGSILSRLLLHSKQFSRAPLGLLCLLQWPLLQPAAPCFQPCFRRAKGRAGHHSCARDCSGCSVANLSLRGGCSWLLLCLLKSQASQQRGSARSGSDFPPIQACIPDPERAVFHELSMYIAKPCAEARGRRAPVKGALHSRQRSRRNRGLGPQWHHHWPQAHRLSVNRFHGPICAVIKPGTSCWEAISSPRCHAAAVLWTGRRRTSQHMLPHLRRLHELLWSLLYSASNENTRRSVPRKRLFSLTWPALFGRL